MDGATTLFVGAHYEKIGSSVTKYYMAGASRVAVRKDGTLSYLLADHLGSSSISTDAAGTRTSELRYKAWGESRYSYGTLPTKYTFTGQYSYMDDPSTPGSEGFGLMYYGARWYDASLGRFAQADSIVPTSTQGTQAWDRYAYVNGNPVRYGDPTGHYMTQGPEDSGGNTTVADSEYNRQRGNALKCQAGNETYCSYAENHPVEYITGVVGSLAFVGAGEYFLLGGGLTGEAAVSLLARLGTYNAKNTLVSLGTNPTYWRIGASQGLSYFKLAPPIYYIADKVLGIAKPANAQFMYNAIAASKNFGVTLTRAAGPGFNMERQIIQSSGQYISTLVQGFTMFFQHIP